MAPTKIIFGCAALFFATSEEVREYLEICERHKIDKLDTARRYGNSETLLGKQDAGKRFIIDTKLPVYHPGDLTKDIIIERQETSFKELGVESVDTLYLHSPDTSTPVHETCAAMDALHKAGKFKRFGLSNFFPAQVQEVYDCCKANNYILPTVFQGMYSPVTRHPEADLIPLCRKLGISYNAYSPIAGGFLVKTVEGMKNGGSGRWDPNHPAGKLYHSLYNRPKMLEGLQQWEDIANDAGLGKAEMAFRFARYHSILDGDKGDGIVIGATKPEQLEQALLAIEKGPLDENVAKRIDAIWETVKDDAPYDTYQGQDRKDL